MQTAPALRPALARTRKPTAERREETRRTPNTRRKDEDSTNLEPP